MWHVWVTGEVEESERKGSLGSKRRKLENRPHIKMDDQEVGYRSLDWIDLAQDRNRWRSPNGNELPSSKNAGNFLTR
jgi:hypothetical protein